MHLVLLHNVATVTGDSAMLFDSPLLVLEKIFMLVGEELDEERKIPVKLRRRGDLGGEFW